MCDRFYSEQYGLAFYFLANPDRFKALSLNYYISEDPELSKILDPLWAMPELPEVEHHGGSFWFEVR